jgi:hypothetical protein
MAKVFWRMQENTKEYELRTKRSRYQQGSIKKVQRAKVGVTTELNRGQTPAHPAPFHPEYELLPAQGLH